MKVTFLDYLFPYITSNYVCNIIIRQYVFYLSSKKYFVSVSDSG